MLIFDIGANRGFFTDKCLQTYSDSTIVMVEANLNLYELLVNKYKNNNNVLSINKAMSKNSGEIVEFFISNADTVSTVSTDWINKSRFSGQYSWNPVKIETLSLDRLIDWYGKPDLIKIDVEGYELEVLQGLTTKQKEICFEWAEEEYEKINKTCEHLKVLGYESFGFIHCDDYLIKPEKFDTWENCELHKLVDPNRKTLWGMIWTH